MTTAQMEAKLDQLERENAALKAKGERKITLKVSEKGCVSLCGLRRFPVSLYAQEWERVFGVIDEIKAFIEANKSQLSYKG